MRNFHSGRIHLDKLCQNPALSAVLLRTATTAGRRKMAEFSANSATAEREPHKWLAGTYDDNAGDQEPSVLETSRSNVSIRTAAAGIANSNST